MRPLIDPFGRTVTYLRVSITDRCDFRCNYCMAEDVTFLPRKDLLSLEELDRVCSAFIERGVRKLRLTGGEPLVRRNVMTLIEGLSRHLDSGALEELTLTTNGSQLARHAKRLASSGVKRVNVSLDTLDPDRFKSITGQDRLNQVLDGLAAAKAEGLRIKINRVALPPLQDPDLDAMIAWCGEQGFDLTLIEAMPLGENSQEPPVEGSAFLSLSDVRADLETRWTLSDVADSTGGPARYCHIAETGQRIGFITPLSAHFCDTCNRVRLTCTGRLYLCLGQEASADLRTPLRASEGDAPLYAAIDAALARKPQGHEFLSEGGDTRPIAGRHMNLTGG